MPTKSKLTHHTFRVHYSPHPATLLLVHMSSKCVTGNHHHCHYSSPSLSFATTTVSPAEELYMLKKRWWVVAAEESHFRALCPGKSPNKVSKYLDEDDLLWVCTGGKFSPLCFCTKPTNILLWCCSLFLLCKCRGRAKWGEIAYMVRGTLIVILTGHP